MSIHIVIATCIFLHSLYFLRIPPKIWCILIIFPHPQSFIHLLPDRSQTASSSRTEGRSGGVWIIVFWTWNGPCTQEPTEAIFACSRSSQATSQHGWGPLSFEADSILRRLEGPKYIPLYVLLFYLHNKGESLDNKSLHLEREEQCFSETRSSALDLLPEGLTHDGPWWTKLLLNVLLMMGHDELKGVM